MSEFGLKIKNMSAGSIYEYNLGVRDRIDYKDAMLTNSLFLDFLLDNGLTVWKGESTRDVICIDFNYGSKSYEQELRDIRRHLEERLSVVDEEKHQEIIEFYNGIIDNATANKDKYVKMSHKNIRTEFYINGVDINYISRNKDGEIKKSEIVHYKMLYRTPGKAKKGSCMFINEKLYDKAFNFLRMFIQLPEHNSPIVEMGAYSSLATSSIVGRVRINPKNILVLKDVDAFFETQVVSIETDDDKHCVAKTIDKYKFKNTLFDGQALIDSGIFPEWANGYVLLRHHLCKMAAFCSNIQTFFKDYFGDKYYSAQVTDMWGNLHYAKDIELITTDNAMKWMKFNVSYDYWCDRVYENNCMFGIVKTAHKSKLGEVQKMSYQMINALDYDIMPSVVQCSIDYVTQLKTNDEAFLNYLRDNRNFSNDYEVLIALVEQDREFLRSEYFRDRKSAIIKSYVMNLKNGKIIENADNLVIVGSPYAMLLYSVGEDPYCDTTFNIEKGTIQCWTERFKSGDYLAEFRSPFNSKNNMGYLHNVYNEIFDKYFSLGSQIIAVNMIGTDFQDRNNGSDMDSDSIYTTNQPDIVEHARYCYLNYPTIVNNIPMEKNNYDDTLENYAEIDNNLAAAQLAIGESSNLAQLCLTYSYNFEDQKYKDYVCILSVLAQVAIDNAKRRFDIDLNNEIAKIKSDMNIKENGYPAFWTIIRRGFNKQKVNYKLKCPMNYIFDIEIPQFKPNESTRPMRDFFMKYEMLDHKCKSKRVEELIQKYSFDLYNYNISEEEDVNESYLLLMDDFDQLINDIKKIYISKNYLGLMSWLIDRAFCITSDQKRNIGRLKSTIDTNKSLLIKVLYDVNSASLLKCFSKNLS